MHERSRRWRAVIALLAALLLPAACGDDAATDDFDADLGQAACLEEQATANTARVPVLKVVRDIPAGTSGDDAVAEGLVATDELPLELRPETALDDVEQLRGGTAVADLAANQVVTGPMFDVTPPAPPTTTSTTACEDA